MSAAATAIVAPERASARDWLAVFGAILGAFTAILDIQITNASLADIQGALGASTEEGSWISTAYLMAEIIVIPLTGWLASVIGLRRYLAVNTMLFTGFSLACALSTSLGQMILFRAGQGFTGGVLIPTAIVIVRTRLSKSQQPIGIALFGLTATFAPAIGPTVGGWLTDNLSWHYIFYLNLIFGPLAAAIQLGAFDSVPARWSELLKGDWIGIGFMATGLPALTFVLEEGQRKDWFGSPIIVKASLLAAAGIIGFIIRELMAERPFINLRVLANRSVGGACLLMTVLGAVSFGSIYIIPVYCAQIQGYNAQQIGYVVMWSGLPQLLLFPMMPLIMRTFDARLLVIAGALFFIASCWINVGLTHDVGVDQLILPQLLRAIGQPLFVIPLSQLSTVGLGPRDTADASALSNMMRNLGGSIGIAMLSTMIDRREHMHFSVLAEAITVNATRTQERLAALVAGLHGHIADPLAAKGVAVGMLAQQVRREAYVMAYADGFWLVGVSLVLSLAVVALLKKPQRSSAPVEAH
ncbi:DHA2 family efflux MFS transporter permease subunit [Methylobacterium brachythecii]|uniref:DHA2 family multidrug resistance protein n=1 Tax=Methylobacterium brachythecii TaxID=1176177 RepID=A0A7W6F870_9HYPH|nr:DHA2 family efflux MFS transporter permease subunit [Methylobacterium brachythecii]MBB3903861.1 DHA2 family multidrug resistance protein [Methylobacterium brachythecii]GLS42610.1 EmrB/QacA family drug resistance transporter [Methylobacterium brachythecii]